MENKKTKLTISGSSKKPFKNFDSSKSQGKKTVIIDNQSKKPFSKGGFKNTTGSRFSSTTQKKGNFQKTNFSPKTTQITSDFEKRKLAEQRATKRLKEENDNKDKKTKLGTKKKRS